MLAPECLDQPGGNSRRPEKNNCVKARIETLPHDGGTIVEARAPPTPELTFIGFARVEAPPHPEPSLRSDSDLSPQAGRGDPVATSSPDMSLISKSLN
jgi:hypothetical protein